MHWKIGDGTLHGSSNVLKSEFGSSMLSLIFGNMFTLGHLKRCVYMGNGHGRLIHTHSTQLSLSPLHHTTLPVPTTGLLRLPNLPLPSDK